MDNSLTSQASYSAVDDCAQAVNESWVAIVNEKRNRPVTFIEKIKSWLALVRP